MMIGKYKFNKDGSLDVGDIKPKLKENGINNLEKTQMATHMPKGASNKSIPDHLYRLPSKKNRLLGNLYSTHKR